MGASMRKTISLGAVFLAFGVVPCFGQSVNYGALEELFGEPVTTAATGSAQRASDAPVNMEIITADDIRRSGATNVPDVLRFVSGVDVRSYGASDADVGIRGYNTANSPRVLVLLNGRQIYVDFHSYTAWATLPVQLEEIRQIEVIKGPNTSLFGFNAVGGVINIVTVDPIYDSINEVTIRGGSRGTQQTSGVATVHNDVAGLRLSASENGTHDFSTSDQASGYGPFPSHDFNRTFYAHGRAALPSGVDLSGELDLTNAKQFEMTVGGYPGWTDYSTNREKVGIGGKTALGYLNLNLYRNDVEFDYEAGENCATCVSILNTVYVAQASDLLKPGADHTVRLGLEYRNNRGGGTAFQNESFGFDVYAANAMWAWQVAPKVAVTNAVRYDYMTFTYSGPVASGVLYTAQQYNSHPLGEASFNSAVVYQATDVDTLRVSVARGVQTPDFYALFPEPVSSDPAFQVGTVTAFQGTPNLKATVIMNYETDYDRALPMIDSKAQLAVFYQTSRDLIGPPGDAGVTDPNTNYGYAGNIGSSRVAGTELSLKGSNPEGWRWKTSYSLALVKDNTIVNQDSANPDSSVDNTHGTPVHAVVVGLGRSWGQFEADMSTRWQSSFNDIAVNNNQAFQSYFIKNYFTTDTRIGYTPLDQLTLALSGQQLNHASQTESAGARPERRAVASATYRF